MIKLTMTLAKANS